jgi:tryptophan synthase alpha chain
MSSIDDLFLQLRGEGRKALMPFVTAGDPDVEFTGKLLGELARRGCHLCEVGIPYSDPVADGPVIQASYTRALDNYVQVQSILDMLGNVASQVTTPLVTMVSYAIVYRQGLEHYADMARQRGIAGLIVPDLPAEESSALSTVCKARDLSLIPLVTPTTPRDRAVRIAQAATGFLYYVSVTGITGERTELPPKLLENVGWLREQTDLPICIGFGISQPEHVQQLAPVADGLIVGSALVRRIATANEKGQSQVVREIGDYVSTLLAALDE